MIANYSYESLRDAIGKRVRLTKDKKKQTDDPRLAADSADLDEFKEETEEEKTKRHGFPNYDVEKLFEEVGAKKYIEELNKLKIAPRVFWTLEEKQL